MPDFYKQYRFADNDAPVQDWDHFLNIRIGAQLIKDTGDKFEKVADHVFNKVARYYLSNEDVEDKFALLHETNTFTDPQYCTAEPTEPYHIVNKEYVDACIATAQVDLSGFARLDRENIWEEPQTCNSEPENRAHLTNKAYVDDRINEIEFDTTSLAKVNSPNVFTAPQSCTVESTAPEHFVTKQYVDDTKTQIIDNISGFVRADLPNTFTATQTFQYTVIVPSPQTDTEAANKLYVDTKVTETQQKLGNFAALDLANIFEKDQTFRTNAICSTPPSQSYHLVNKEYVDAVLEGFQLPDGLASTNVENTWDAVQNFAGGITVPPAVEDDDLVTKGYVDGLVQSFSAPDATWETKGIVKLAKTISSESPQPPGTQTASDFAQDNNVATGKMVAAYVQGQTSATIGDAALKSKANIFSAANTFSSDVTINGNSTLSDVSIAGTATAMSAVISNATGTIVTSSFNAKQALEPEIPGNEFAITLGKDSDGVVIPNRVQGPTTLPEGTEFMPIFEYAPAYNTGNDVAFGVIDISLNEDISDAVVGTAIYSDIVTDDGSVSADGETFYIGIRSNASYLYPAANMVTPWNNATDGIVTTKYLLNSPWSVATLSHISLDGKTTSYPTKQAFFSSAVESSKGGVATVSAEGFVHAVNNGWLKGDITVTSDEPTIDLDELDASGLNHIEFSGVPNFTLTVRHAKNLVLSNITNATINAVNSVILLNEASGTINASRHSHVVLKQSDATINLTYDSTCDDLDVPGAADAGTHDASSWFYSEGSSQQVPDKVSITFDAAGGTPEQDPITVDKGTTWADVKGKVTNPSKSGYNFLGWSVQS